MLWGHHKRLSMTATATRAVWHVPPPANEVNRRLIFIAAASRACVLSLAIVANLLLPDHKGQGVEIFDDADVARSEVLTTFTRWDSAHFLTIAKGAYTREDQHAFFPLYPLCIRYLSRLLTSIHAQTTPGTDGPALVISGLIISNVSFIAAALALHALTLAVIKDRRFSWASSLLFIFSPSSIFFTTVYSESLYAALSFTGHYLWHTDRYVTGTCALALASLTRSNGLLNALPLVASLLLPPAKGEQGGGQKAGYNGVQEAPSAPTGGGPPSLSQTSAAAVRATMFVVPSLRRVTAVTAACVAIAFPYLAFQAHGWWRYCPAPSPDEPLWRQPIWWSVLGIQPKGTPSDSNQTWCHAPLPNLYNHVQSMFWGVGPFRYWRLKQVPNFLLAAPVLGLSASGVYRYFSGLFRRGMAGPSVAAPGMQGVYSTPRALGLQAQWGVLAIFSVIVAHVQISTRLLGSSCPPLYWFMAMLMTDPSVCTDGTRKLLVGYIALYNILGPLMHCNFLPWT